MGLRVFNGFGKVINEYLIIFFLLFYLLVPNIYLSFRGSDFVDPSISKKVLFILISLIFLSFPLIFIRPRYFFLFAILYVFLAPIEITTIYINKTSINAGIYYVMFNTTIREATELLRGLLPLVIICLIYIAVYIYIVIKYVPSKLTINRRYRLVFGILLIVALLGIWLRGFYISKSIQKSKPISLILKTSNSSFFNKFHKIFPYSAFVEAKGAIANRIYIERLKKNTRNFRFNAYKKDKLENDEIYVLIIGETSRSQNWQLYGYKRPTNPYLSEIQNLCTFSNFLSNANFTDLSLSLILSRATPDSFNISYEEKNIVAAFKEAGFMTYWISNQGIFNDDMERLIIDADKVYNINNRFDYSGSYDENIFPLLDSALNLSYKKKFIVIHLLGSHFQYHYRYPKKFMVFKPGFDESFKNFMINPKNKEQLVNTYDNSILYTDFILASIIKKIEAQHDISIVMYISDHGENLYDDENGYFAHGSETPTKYEVIIPFFVWYSDIYEYTYPEKMSQLTLNKNKRTSTTNLFYSLLDAANIYYDNENTVKSFFSVDFIEDSVRKVIVPSRKVVVFDKK